MSRDAEPELPANSTETGPPSHDDAEAVAPGDRAARASVVAWVILFATTVLSIVTDLWSKAAAFASVAGQPVAVERSAVLAADRLGELIPPHDPVVVVPNLLEFTLVLNPGAVFGVGAGRRWLFIVFTVFAAAFAIWLFGWWTRARDRLAHVAFGLLIGGGTGNLYDRLVHGCVRDFLHPLPGVPMPFGITWPSGSTDLWPYVSNVADAQLLVGIAVLLVYFWRAEGSTSNADQPPSHPPSE